MSTRKRPLPDTEGGAAVGPLSGFDLRGFRPSPNLSDDLNYMDVVMILTRSQTLRQGSMGCILVRPKNESAIDIEEDEGASNAQSDGEGNGTDDFFGRIIAAATNSSLFKSDDSDVHAEINAIGQVAKRDIKAHVVSSQGTTAYITMPPCKRCFGALHASGIRRIVARTQHSSVLLEAASTVGIEMASMTKQEMLAQKERMDKLFATHFASKKEDGNEGAEGIQNAEGNAEEVLRRRKERKEEKKARKLARLAQIAKTKAEHER
ncbi:hypothetical protein ACHAXT_005250 [Thalassiosira profunda]